MNINIIITITSLFVLVITLFFTDYQIRSLYIETKKVDSINNGASINIPIDNNCISKNEYSNLENQCNTFQKQIDDLTDKNNLFEKNITGIFENSQLVNENNKCLDISKTRRGAFNYLEVSDFEKCNDIFTYDPIDKHIIVKTNEGNKCITSLNENDLVLNDCVKTFDKQQFHYYPMHDGKFHSSLYSKCLSYNKDSNIIELSDCNASNNILKTGNLFLPNS